MENRINIHQITQYLIDIMGCEMYEINRMRYRLQQAYSERYMPDTHLMSGTPEVEQLCREHFNQLLFDFYHSIRVLKNACYEETEPMYLLTHLNNEGAIKILVEDGVEIFNYLEKYVLKYGMEHISDDMRAYANLINETRAIKDKVLKELHFKKGYDKIFKKK